MKRLSLKTRLALFYTGLMTLVLGLVLGVLFSVSSQEILTGVQNTLEERVSSSIEDVEFRQGRLEFDSELLSLENGVYLSVYQPGDFSLLYGRLPYGFAYDLAFSDGELRTVSAGEAEYYVLDLEFPVEGYGDLVLRGVVSLSDAERDFRFTLRLALILFPLLIALTALCGYLLSRRALGPVAQITQTVRNIQRERDLSKRVRLGEGRDEIYTLAQTFDSLLDQLIAIAEYQDIEPVIVITKCDVADPSDFAKIYTDAGFTVCLTRTLEHQGIEQVMQVLQGKTSAFCGNSGAGKSTLLNAIDPRLALSTGDISQKLGRGRHTTRHVELFELPQGGYVADTPGFSAVDLEKFQVILKDELAGCFREMRPYEGKCRFTGCSHTKEKGCAVLEAVQEGKIAPSRHQSYVALYEQAKNIKEWEIGRETR